MGFCLPGTKKEQMMHKQGLHIFIPVLVILSGILGCTDPWNNYYEAEDARVNMKLWDAVRQEPRFSGFVNAVEAGSLDSLFDKGLTHTLFIPDNEALSQMLDTALNPEQVLLYHISPTLFLPGIVQDKRRLQTLTGKYVFLEENGDEFTMDGLPVQYTSPLFMDGKYYELSGAAFPRPNLYEYTDQFSPFIKKYIDSREIVYLDLELSQPIGFDPAGNTIYDSIFGNVNLFEQEYFPVSEEFRSKNATFILFTQEQYSAALEQMASVIGTPGGGANISEKWQLEELMPELMKTAMFEGMLEYSDLMKGRLESITGDSVDIDYMNIDPDSKFICSNGHSYLYHEFSIDSSFFMGSIQVEGESLIDTLGIGAWTWKHGVLTTGINVSPIGLESTTASKGAVLLAPFSRGFTGEFSMEFTIKNVLPMRYRLIWSSNSRPSGLFAIYVNDIYIGEFDSNKFRSTVQSVTGEYFRPDNGFNRKDFWVDNLTEFGDVKIRFVYLGPGLEENNGLNIDYVKLIPAI